MAIGFAASDPWQAPADSDAASPEGSKGNAKSQNGNRHSGTAKLDDVFLEILLDHQKDLASMLSRCEDHLLAKVEEVIKQAFSEGQVGRELNRPPPRDPDSLQAFQEGSTHTRISPEDLQDVKINSFEANSHDSPRPNPASPRNGVSCAPRKSEAEIKKKQRSSTWGHSQKKPEIEDALSGFMEDMQNSRNPKKQKTGLFKAFGGAEKDKASNKQAKKQNSTNSLDGEKEMDKVNSGSGKVNSFGANVTEVNKQIGKQAGGLRASWLIRGGSGSNKRKEEAPKFLKCIISPKFDIAVCFLILVNSVVIGIECDLAAKEADADKEPQWIRMCNLIFLGLFSFELVLRLCAEQKNFFTSDDWRWNVFDLFVVCVGVLDQLLQFLALSTGILRVFRMLRIVRFVRLMRFCTDLRKMVKGIIDAIGSLFWVIVLLASIIFIAGVAVTMSITFHRMETDDSETDDDIIRNFGSLSGTMYNMYGSISSGVDWLEVSDQLFRISPILGCAFIMYMTFCVFAVMNVVTGVFVDNAIKSASEDKDIAIIEQTSARQKFMDEIRTVFESTDTDGSGHIGFEEFQICAEKPVFQAYFRHLGLDIELVGANEVFKLLDFDGTGEIDQDEFILGCSYIKGGARSLDVARLLHTTDKLVERCKGIEDNLISTKTMVSSISNEVWYQGQDQQRVIDDVKQLKQLRGIVPRLLPRPHGGSRFQGASIARSNKSGLPRPKG